jgi:hypothetical protein
LDVLSLDVPPGVALFDALPVGAAPAVVDAEAVAGVDCVDRVVGAPALDDCEVAAARAYEAETEAKEAATSDFFRIINPREDTTLRESTKAALGELTGFIKR